MHWYTDVVFKKYAVFDGRARRPEFWWFFLANLIVAVAILIVATIAFGEAGGQVVYYVYLLATLLPSLGVQIRRLHDTDRSGWWVLIAFIPFIGWIAILVLLALGSTPGANRFGDGEVSSADGLQPLAPPPGQTYCSTCGAALQPGAAFCGNCGAAQPS